MRAYNLKLFVFDGTSSLIENATKFQTASLRWAISPQSLLHSQRVHSFLEGFEYITAATLDAT